jgi:hypothetical protein
MKIKLQFFILIAGLSYAIFILHSSFSSAKEIGFQDENSLTIEVNSPQLANRLLINEVLCRCMESIAFSVMNTEVQSAKFHVISLSLFNIQKDNRI